MEFERCYKTLQVPKRSFTRSTTKAILCSTRSIIRCNKSNRSPSHDRISRIILNCDSHVTVTKSLKEQINKLDKEISQDLLEITDKKDKKTKFYDENYIANAVRIFRDQKKAFIYTKRRFITGTNRRNMIDN